MKDLGFPFSTCPHLGRTAPRRHCTRTSSARRPAGVKHGTATAAGGPPGGQRKRHAEAVQRSTHAGRDSAKKAPWRSPGVALARRDENTPRFRRAPRPRPSLRARASSMRGVAANRVRVQDPRRQAPPARRMRAESAGGASRRRRRRGDERGGRREHHPAHPALGAGKARRGRHRRDRHRRHAPRPLRASPRRATR